jgi:CubicO group peptidase (beta-lactamase class C family)
MKKTGRNITSKTRRNRALILVVFLLVIAAVIVGVDWGTHAPKKPDLIPIGDYSYTIEDARYRIVQLMESKHLPSVAVALIADQEIIWQETFGTANLEEGIPAESNTVYKLWSVAKVFTAIETMRLVEEGLVELDAPITDYIPDFSIQNPFADSGPVTIRSILAHRAGLPRNGCIWVDFSPDALSALVASLEECLLAYPPHYRFKYSNIGIDTLGLIIEKMRDVPFPVYMHENLLLPIGMNNSAFMQSQIPDQRYLAPGYEYYKGDYYPYEQYEIASMPSGNLYSTIEDMGTFVRFIFRDGNADAGQIIQPDTLEAMFMMGATSARDPQPMGLGWKTAQVFGSERLVWHDGGPSEGTGALVAFLPERKLGVALIANGTTFDGSISVTLALDILETMLETKYGLTVPVEEPQEAEQIDENILMEYVGKYVAFGEMMNVVLDGDRLKGSIQGFTFNLKPLDDGTFQPGHWLADIGLASRLGVPIELQRLGINFMEGDEISSDFMIINVDDIFHEICPRYPDFETIPMQWNGLTGEYDLVARLPLGMTGSEILGHARIDVEDGVLQMSGAVGPILPIGETELLIIGGPFAGEIVTLDPTTGNLYHQKYVYIHR